MNQCLALDCEMTKGKYRKQKLPDSLVERTWSELLKGENTAIGQLDQSEKKPELLALLDTRRQLHL